MKQLMTYVHPVKQTIEKTYEYNIRVSIIDNV